MKRSFQSVQITKIKSRSLVKVKQMKGIIEVMSLKYTPNGFNGIKKLSKEEYMVLDTGEVKEYVLSQNRAQNIESFKKTTKRIRDLINNNFEGKQNELHITLTYAENMTDKDQLYRDFDNFWKKFKYKYGKNIDYISVVEPQGRGAWHCHVLVRFNDLDKIYIPNKWNTKVKPIVKIDSPVYDLWKKGNVTIRPLNGIDNIGAYLSAYLADIELTDENLINTPIEDKLEVKAVEIEGQSKKFIKGGRIHLYPSGMNIVRKSKGILYPEVEEMLYLDTKKIVGDSSPTYSKTVTILDENENVLQEIAYETYNTRRVAARL